VPAPADSQELARNRLEAILNNPPEVHESVQVLRTVSWP